MRKFLIILFIVFLLAACKTPPQDIQIPEEVVETIEVITPEFEVTSIYILQADIVVTEFEAIIKIDNPNHFAIELSSINYELYGNGEFWANGTAADILHIPALSSGETRFTFSMNFINMSRRLLDDVIAMRQINYRFKGQARMRPVINNLPAFNADFDCSGLSEVRRRAN